ARQPRAGKHRQSATASRYSAPSSAADPTGHYMAKIDLLVVIAYMAAILAAGFWARRKATTQEQFLVAGRAVGPWLYPGTLAAFMLGLGIIVLSVVFVERILGLNLYTVPELLERRYSPFARIAGGVVMVAYDLMVSVTATIAVGSVMEVSSRPGEFHPQALTDPDMNVSAHPALIVQPPLDAAIASEQRARDRARQPCESSVR